MQPGMPQGAGVVDGTAVITLPGNPVSALVSSSRAILYASTGDDYADAAAHAARSLRDTLNAAR